MGCTWGRGLGLSSPKNIESPLPVELIGMRRSGYAAPGGKRGAAPGAVDVWRGKLRRDRADEVKASQNFRFFNGGRNGRKGGICRVAEAAKN